MSFEQGLADTVKWYRENSAWWEAVKSGEYQAYYEKQYGSLTADKEYKEIGDKEIWKAGIAMLPVSFLAFI